MVSQPDDTGVAVVARVPDEVQAGRIYFERQLPHPEPVYEPAVLADQLGNRSDEVGIPENLGNNRKMVNGGCNTPALALLIQEAIYETMGIP